MNASMKMNEGKGAEIISLRPAKSPERPAVARETAKSPAATQADITTMCVSKSGYKRELFVPARIVAEAVRLILDEELPPPRGPGHPGADDTWLDDTLDNLTGLMARTPEEREKLPKLPRGFMFDPDGPGPVERSSVNRDLDYRSRAELREVCRKDPSAFSRAIPHDIADRVTIPNNREEALAILEAVCDVDPAYPRYSSDRHRNRDGSRRVCIGRPAREWLKADPDEPVLLVDYNPPKVRLRSRPIPGVVLSSDDGAIVLTLRARDIDSPSQRKRQEAAPEPVKLAA
jgi:hypothetical protein